MKKSLFIFAAAALALTACSSDNEATQTATQKAAPQAVAFDTYLTNTTRAGAAGVMTTSTLQTTGFGVFAQYSNGTTTTDGAYANTTNPSNFMWNEKISYSASAWTYSPLKYWPNETDNDSQTPQATSQHADKLSFFAYAPYVKELNGIYTGKLDIDGDGSTDEYDAAPAITASGIKTAKAGGIEAVISNSATGNDPWVRYSVAETPSESVDLLWGVAPAGDLSYTNVGGGTTTITAGEPLVDLIKPSKDQKIKFLFQHALARIGLKVVAAFDQISAGGVYNAATTKTIIAVNSVTITESTATKYLKTSGALNLKNLDAYKSLWSNTSGLFSVTVNSSNELNPDIAYTTSATATWTKHEGAIATPTPTDTWTGVTNAEVDVIKDVAGPTGKTHYFMVIPNNTATPYVDTDVDLDVTINYTVITKDDKLSGGFSEVNNEITKKITISNFTNNKAYTLKLILGLTSVKLDAEVADWQVDGSTEVYLPRNNE